MNRHTTSRESVTVPVRSEMDNTQASERRSQSSLYSILVIDINDFARFNDRYGHQTGDRILQQFAEFLKALFRNTDTYARFQCDVYAVLLPKTDAAGSLAAARRLQAAIALHHWDEETLTVCVGAATSKPSTVDAEQVTEEAEQALRRAKQLGEGCVVHFDRL